MIRSIITMLLVMLFSTGCARFANGAQFEEVKHDQEGNATVHFYRSEQLIGAAVPLYIYDISEDNATFIGELKLNGFITKQFTPQRKAFKTVLKDEYNSSYYEAYKKVAFLDLKANEEYCVKYYYGKYSFTPSFEPVDLSKCKENEELLSTRQSSSEETPTQVNINTPNSDLKEAITYMAYRHGLAYANTTGLIEQTTGYEMVMYDSIGVQATKSAHFTKVALMIPFYWRINHNMFYRFSMLYDLTFSEIKFDTGIYFNYKHVLLGISQDLFTATSQNTSQKFVQTAVTLGMMF